MPGRFSGFRCSVRRRGSVRSCAEQVDDRQPSDELDPVAAEAYHFVLASLEHALSGVGGKVVAVASAGPGDGKTVTVLNLALAAEREGRKVRLVDADERTRRLSLLCRDGEPFDVIGLNMTAMEASAAVALAGTAARQSRCQVEPSATGTTRPCSSAQRPSAD